MTIKNYYKPSLHIDTDSAKASSSKAIASVRNTYKNKFVLNSKDFQTEESEPEPLKTPQAAVECHQQPHNTKSSFVTSRDASYKALSRYSKNKANPNVSSVKSINSGNFRFFKDTLPDGKILQLLTF